MSSQTNKGQSSQPRIALVCDWLTTPGGAEKVLLELHRMYPDAPIYTSQYSKKGLDWFNDATVKTGWLQIFPKFLRKFLGPLRQLYFSHLDLSAYDFVISVTGAEAKSVRTRPKTKKTHPNLPLYHTSGKKSIDNIHRGAYHLCYCHVPTQYYWQMYDKYIENPGFGPLNPIVRFFFKLLVKPLRKADFKAAQRPNQFITISHYAADQIQKYYHRESVIIAPPVEISKFNHSSAKPKSFSTKNRELSTETPDLSTAFPPKKGSYPPKPQTFPQYHYQLDHPDLPPQIICPQPPQYYIIACRQVTWKRVDLAIEACLKAEAPLLVVGDGPERARLVKLAADSPLIKFLPWTKSNELAIYLQNAKAYLFPSLEPFGIAAVEALAAGCPVIAYQDGGSRDFIQDGKNGLLFAEQTPTSLAKAITRFQTLHFDRAKISHTADSFSVDHFRQGMSKLIQSKERTS